MRVLLSTLGILLLLSGRAMGETTFERDVRPLLKAHCFGCHGEAKRLAGGLDLRLRWLMAAGGHSGEAIVPGKSNESLLIDYVSSGEMPPKDELQLSPQEIATIAKWIDAGRRRSITLRTNPLYSVS